MSLEGTLSIGDETHPLINVPNNYRHLMYEHFAMYNTYAKVKPYNELKPILNEINEFYNYLLRTNHEDSVITDEVKRINYHMDGRFAEIK